MDTPDLSPQLPESELRAELKSVGLVPVRPSEPSVSRMRSALSDHVANAELKEALALELSDRVPDPLTVRRMRSELHRHIEDEAETRRYGRACWMAGRRLVRAAAVVAAFVLVVALGIGLRPGVQSPAEALHDLAVAVDTLPDDQLKGVAIQRTVTTEAVSVESVPSQTATLVEVPVWFIQNQLIEYASDGSVRLTETFTSVEPLIPVDGEARSLLEASLNVGATETAVFPPEAAATSSFDLSGDVEEVSGRIDTHLANFADPSTPYVGQLFEFVGSLYQTQLIGAPERATLLEVLASTDTVEATSNGDLTDAVTSYHAQAYGSVLHQLTFDAQGWLVSDRISTTDSIASLGLAEGSVVRQVTSTPPTHLN